MYFLFSHLITKYLPSPYHVPSVMLGTMDRTGEDGLSLGTHVTYILDKEKVNMQISKVQYDFRQW